MASYELLISPKDGKVVHYQKSPAKWGRKEVSPNFEIVTADLISPEMISGAYWDFDALTLTWPDDNNGLGRNIDPVRLPGKLAVCTCYFNPLGWQTRVDHFQRFAEAVLSQGADLHVIAAVTKDDPKTFLPEIGGGTVIVVEMDSLLWQKERMLNLLIERLPVEYDKVAWLDSDILFDNPRWVEETCRQLDRFRIVQLFSQAVWLNRADVPEYWWTGGKSSRLYRPSVPQATVQEANVSFGTAHPGFAWAARRETLEQIGGLYDQHIAGSADSIMAIAWYGWFNHAYFKNFLGPFLNVCDRWVKKTYGVVQGSVWQVPGLVRHLWHGTRADRHYDGRIFRMSLIGFDPDRHLEKSPNGLWRWTDEVPEEIKREVERYFHARREDG